MFDFRQRHVDAAVVDNGQPRERLALRLPQPPARVAQRHGSTGSVRGQWPGTFTHGDTWTTRFVFFCSFSFQPVYRYGFMRACLCGRECACACVCIFFFYVCTQDLYDTLCVCFSFQPVLHDWCNKGCGMCYPVCGMVHVKTLAVNRKE